MDFEVGSTTSVDAVSTSDLNVVSMSGTVACQQPGVRKSPPVSECHINTLCFAICY